MSLTDSGVGSAIVRRVAKTDAGHRNEFRGLLLACVRFYVPLAFILIVAVFSILWGARRDVLLGAGGGFVLLALIIVGLQVILMPVARIYLGAGLIAVWNKLAIISNGLFLIVILMALKLSLGLALPILLLGHAVTSLVLPLFGIWKLRGSICGELDRARDEAINLDVRRELWREAGSQVPILVSGVIQREFPKWGLVVLFPAVALGRLGLLLTALGAVGGLVGMFTNIIWPQICGAIHRGDGAGARQSRNFLYFIFVGFLIVLWGGGGVLMWCGGGGLSVKGFSYNAFTLVLFGVFSTLVIWEHVHYSILMGIDRLKLVARVSAIQALVAVFFWWILPGDDEVVRYFSAQIFAYILCSAVTFPVVVYKQL